MISFKWVDYIKGYEIDYYNDATKKEQSELKEKLGLSETFHLGLYHKEGDEWYSRSSGMIFKIKDLDYYPRLKEHLDSEFNKFMRKIKLEKLTNG